MPLPATKEREHIHTRTITINAFRRKDGLLDVDGRITDVKPFADHMLDGIMQRAVKRGLSRRAALSPRQISVDETSYRKGHDYVTVVTDQEQAVVLHVAENRETGSLAECYELLSEEQKKGIESVCMDMWPAHIRATRDALTDADSKIRDRS